MLPWDGTFVAAVVAAVVGIASLIVGGVSARAVRQNAERTLALQRDSERRQRESDEREHFRSRLEMGIERALSPGVDARRVGIALLNALLDDEWASERDKELVLAVAVALE